MNYFGHAAVASWQRLPPGGVLGAMLPDFAGMCGAKLGSAPDAKPDAEPDVQTDAEIDAGIALHHATDRVFHALAPVTALMADLDARLARLACSRGPRLATAHVGIELLLDGTLVAEPAYRAAYLAALHCDPARTHWQSAEGPTRFAQLLERLRGVGVPDDLREPVAVVGRLERVLGRRPLLAPSPADVRAIRQAIADMVPRVRVASSTVIRSLRAALAAPTR